MAPPSSSLALQSASTCLTCLLLPLASLALGISSYSLHGSIDSISAAALASFVIGTITGLATLAIIVVGLSATWVGDPAFRRAWLIGLGVVASMAAMSASLATVAFYQAPSLAISYWNSMTREAQADFLFRNKCATVQDCQTALVRYLQDQLSTQMGVMWMTFAALALAFIAELGQIRLEGRGLDYKSSEADYEAIEHLGAHEDAVERTADVPRPPQPSSWQTPPAPQISVTAPAPPTLPPTVDREWWSSVPRTRKRTITAPWLSAMAVAGSMASLAEQRPNSGIGFVILDDPLNAGTDPQPAAPALSNVQPQTLPSMTLSKPAFLPAVPEEQPENPFLQPENPFLNIMPPTPVTAQPPIPLPLIAPEQLWSPPVSSPAPSTASSYFGTGSASVHDPAEEVPVADPLVTLALLRSSSSTPGSESPYSPDLAKTSLPRRAFSTKSLPRPVSERTEAESLPSAENNDNEGNEPAVDSADSVPSPTAYQWEQEAEHTLPRSETGVLWDATT